MAKSDNLLVVRMTAVRRVWRDLRHCREIFVSTLFVSAI
jgi:hypothetical protein